MATKAYIGINNKARLVKKIYVGVNNVARKVKRAYIGVNGVAQQFFEYIGNILKYGTTLNLPAGAAYQVGVSSTNYAVFGGGGKNVYGFNSSLVATTATGFDKLAKNHAGAPVGDYAVFAGRRFRWI